MTISMLIEDTDNVIFQGRLDPVEIFIVYKDDSYKVIWGDYIANGWEENYESLGAALARVAVIVQANESGNLNWGFKQSESSEFYVTWITAMDIFVFDEDEEDEVDSN